jgi:polyferredoxin
LRATANHGKKALSRAQQLPYPSAMRNILLIILILLLIGAFPGWGYSSGWGYYPFGGLGLVLLILIILILTGRL